MKNTLFLLISLLLSSTAFAGSQTRTCETRTKDIFFDAGNGSNTIKILYTDESTQKPGVYQVPVRAMPNYDYNSAGGDKAISAIPISERTYTIRSCSRVHVIHADGSECYGRERWTVKYSQSFVFTGQEGKGLDSYDSLGGKSVVGKTKEGYIVRELNCTDEGVTTAGGCYVEVDDKLVEDVAIDCSKLGY